MHFLLLTHFDFNVFNSHYFEFALSARTIESMSRLRMQSAFVGQHHSGVGAYGIFFLLRPTTDFGQTRARARHQTTSWINNIRFLIGSLESRSMRYLNDQSRLNCRNSLIKLYFLIIAINFISTTLERRNNQLSNFSGNCVKQKMWQYLEMTATTVNKLEHRDIATYHFLKLLSIINYTRNAQYMQIDRIARVLITIFFVDFRSKFIFGSKINIFQLIGDYITSRSVFFFVWFSFRSHRKDVKWIQLQNQCT